MGVPQPASRTKGEQLWALECADSRRRRPMARRSPGQVSRISAVLFCRNLCPAALLAQGTREIVQVAKDVYTMPRRMFVYAIVLALLLAVPPEGRAQTWNSTGMTYEQFDSLPPGGPAPRRDISGIWDGGRAGVGAANQ